MPSLTRDEFQRQAVIAVAPAGWFGAVIKNVALMAAATGAVVLGARIEETGILAGLYMIGDDAEEAGPASAAIVFHRRGEEWQLTGGTGECALAFFEVERATLGGFGPLFAEDVVLLRRQQLAPLVVAFDNFLDRAVANAFGQGLACEQRGSGECQ